MRVLREIVPPLVAGYAVFVWVVVSAWRHPTGRPARPSRSRDLVVTIVGGYMAFLLLVAIFHLGLARQRGAFPSAVVGGAFLVLVSSAAFALLSWIETRIHRR